MRCCTRPRCSWTIGYSTQCRLLSSTAVDRQANRKRKIPRLLHQTLSGQDPSHRIAFLPQRVGYERVLRRFGSDVDLTTARESAYLVPFWTVVFLCDVRRGLKHRETGWVQNGRPRQSYMDIGCSIAAVPPGHWASGLVLLDDLRMLVESYSTVKAPKVSSRTNIYDHDEIGWDGLGNEMWDDGRAPAFAFSYPHIAKDHGVKISTLPQASYGDYTETWKMNNAPITFAVPSYRVGYKVDLTGGRIAYVDGHYDLPSHSLVLSHRKDRLASNFSWTPSHSVRYNARKLFEGFHTTQVAREPLLPAFRSAEFAEIMMAAMTASPVAWEDDTILGLNASERSAATLGLRLDDRIFGRVDASNQEIFTATLTPPAPVATKPSQSAVIPPRPAPRVTNIAEAPQQVSNERQDPAPRRIARSTLDSPAMRAKSPTIRPPAPQNLAQPKAPRPTRIRPPLAATVEIARIGDTKGYYALLGITPTKAFLDIQAASVVERELAERRRTLALKFHADRGGGTEGEMSRINAAYDQVSTYTRRKQYEQGG